jgi:recombination protein RecT
LPLNNNLGFAYIVPYKAKQKDGSYKTVAQFQMGYKGFIQLAQRSGQFETISAAPVYEGQLIGENPLTGFEFDFSKAAKKSDTVIGYAAYFKLLNGFNKTLYMSVADLTKHGTRFSQTFKKGYGLWKDDFEGMCIKTVIKLLLSKFAPLSIDMQRAVITDQSVINDADTNDVDYADNEEPFVDAELVSEKKEQERVTAFIAGAKNVGELTGVEDFLTTPEQKTLFDKRLEELSNGG